MLTRNSASPFRPRSVHTFHRLLRAPNLSFFSTRVAPQASHNPPPPPHTCRCPFFFFRRRRHKPSVVATFSLVGCSFVGFPSFIGSPTSHSLVKCVLFPTGRKSKANEAGAAPPSLSLLCRLCVCGWPALPFLLTMPVLSRSFPRFL